MDEDRTDGTDKVLRFSGLELSVMTIRDISRMFEETNSVLDVFIEIGLTGWPIAEVVVYTTDQHPGMKVLLNGNPGSDIGKLCNYLMHCVDGWGFEHYHNSDEDRLYLNYWGTLAEEE